MECNKDEATRAKEIAESKFSSKDLKGAKKFALKAQNLFPDLEGISQLLAVLDVHAAAENKASGEPDYYGILGVNPLAEDDTVKKHYRKLALLLHPDKNKSIGADGAFQLVSQAWNLLSDKDKRMAYDHKRHAQFLKQRVNTQKVFTRVHIPPTQNGFNNVTKSTAPTGAADAQTKATSSQKKDKSTTPAKKKSKKQKDETNGTTKTVPTSVPSSSNEQIAPETSKVKTSRKKNKAKGTTKTGAASASASSKEQMAPVTTEVKTSHQKDKVNGMTKTGPTSIPLPVTKQMKIKTFWTVCMRCKLQYEFLRKYLNRNILCPTCYGPFRATEIPPPDMNATSEVAGISQGTGNKISAPETFKIAGVEAGNGTSSQRGPLKRNREEAGVDTNIEEALRRKIAKKEAKSVSKKVKSVTETKQDVNMEALRSEFAKKEAKSVSTKVKSVAKTKQDMNVVDAIKEKVPIKNQLIKKATIEIKKKLDEWSSEAVKAADMANSYSKSDEVDVPDPDFHDFDEARSEKSFKEGQLWAAYDDREGMPRNYALVHNVISLNPFKMKVCWLRSKPNKKPLPFPGFLEAFGEFQPGKHETVKSPNYFSHKASFSKQKNGNIRVFPKKGSVCALYKRDKTSDMIKHTYDIVEVDDYSEETGVTVTPLVKVAGFKTVFHRHLDNKETRVIPEMDFLKISHQIPSYLLTGQESANAPKGCLDLDPAAIPPEFLHVISDVKEDVNEADKMDIDIGPSADGVCSI